MTSKQSRDWLQMSDIQNLEHVGADSRKWAEWFAAVAEMHSIKIEPEWAQVWFANAMMAMANHIEKTNPPIEAPEA